MKTIEELDIPEKLNIEADIKATTKARTTINTHLLSVPFAIYISKVATFLTNSKANYGSNTTERRPKTS